MRFFPEQWYLFSYFPRSNRSTNISPQVRAMFHNMQNFSIPRRTFSKFSQNLNLKLTAVGEYPRRNKYSRKISTACPLLKMHTYIHMGE